LNHHLTTFQRTYVREVRRCAEIERSLRYLETEVVEGGAKDHIPALDTSRMDVTTMPNIYILEVSDPETQYYILKPQILDTNF
jgi:hypothetical protein